MSEIVGPLGQFELLRPTQPHDHNRTRDRVERRISADFRPGLLRPRPKKRRDGPVGITIRVGRHRVLATDLQFRAIGRDRPSPRHNTTLKKDRIFGDVNGEARMAMLTWDTS